MAREANIQLRYMYIYIYISLPVSESSGVSLNGFPGVQGERPRPSSDQSIKIKTVKNLKKSKKLSHYETRTCVCFVHFVFLFVFVAISDILMRI